jgi:hypothetical protein
VIQAAELVLGVAEAVRGLGLAEAVAGVAVQGEGLLADRPGLLGPAEKDVVPADGVEGEGGTDTRLGLSSRAAAWLVCR